MRRVLCSLAVNPDYVQFGIPQLKSILHNAPVPLDILFEQQLKGKQQKESYLINHQLFANYPLVVLNVPEFEAHRSFFENACKQSVMIHKMILLISMGNTYQELLKTGNQQLLQKYCRNSNEQVLCDFFSKNRAFIREQQIKKIHNVLGGLDIRGHINFKTPNIKYQLIEQHEWYQQHHKVDPSQTMKKVYFGIQLCSNKIATAKFNNKYELNKRIYLGPTSADNDLAFLMCNQALVKNGSIVIDPFVGTGGLLIPPASRGAITFGSDLDIRVLNGYSVGRINKKSPFYNPQKKYQLFTPKINLNFEQYGLDIPNIIRIDATKLTMKTQQLFDSIITDPPYGIRAMSRTVTQKQNEVKEQSGEQRQQQIIQKQSTLPEKQEEKTLNIQENSSEDEKQQHQMTEEELAQKFRKKEKRRIQKQNKKKRYDLLSEQQKQFKLNLRKRMNKERVQNWQKFDKTKVETTEREKIFEGLLSFGKKYLKKRGRLVFLYPIYQQEQYKGVKSLPPHQGFQVIDLSQNKMSKGNSRILVTLQKL